MKKKDAEVLLPLVNSKSHMDCLQYYMNLRIDAIKEVLTTCPVEDVKRLQGAIEEIKRFKNLRDEVLNPQDI